VIVGYISLLFTFTFTFTKSLECVEPRCTRRALDCEWFSALVSNVVGGSCRSIWTAANVVKWSGQIDWASWTSRPRPAARWVTSSARRASTTSSPVLRSTPLRCRALETSSLSTRSAFRTCSLWLLRTTQVTLTPFSFIIFTCCTHTHQTIDNSIYIF